MWSGCFCWNERSLNVQLPALEMFPYESVTVIRQVQPLILLLCFDGWFQSQPCSLRLFFLAANAVTNGVNEWIMNYSSTCVSVKQVQRRCSLAYLCVAAAGGGWSLPQAPAEAAVSGSWVPSQLTWLQRHCSCFCNTRLTSPTRPLIALHCSPQVSMYHTGILGNVL